MKVIKQKDSISIDLIPLRIYKYVDIIIKYPPMAARLINANAGVPIIIELMRYFLFFVKQYRDKGMQASNVQEYALPATQDLNI